MTFSRSRRTASHWISWLPLLLCIGMPVHAQLSARPALNPHSIDGLSMGAPVDLGSKWLAQQGDDPQWAQPGFDDSHWQIVNTNNPLAAQGMKNVNAIWYRTHVQVPAGARHLALMATYLAGGDDIYANGVRIAQLGSAAADGGAGDNGFTYQWIGAIPDSALGQGDLTIAVRSRAGFFSHGGDYPIAGIGVPTKMLLGPASAVRDAYALLSFRNFTSNWTNLTLVAVVLLITLALALTVRNEPEYRVLAVFLAFQIASQVQQLWDLLASRPLSFLEMFAELALSVAGAIALIEFVRVALGVRRRGHFLIYYWILALFVPLSQLFMTFYWNPLHVANNPLDVAFNLLTTVMWIPATMGLPVLAVWVAWRKRSLDAWLLFVPLLVNSSLAYYNLVMYLLYVTHMITGTTMVAARNTPIHAFNVGWNEVTSFAFSVALLVFMVVRTIRLAREKARAASEMQAVKTLQSLLLARSHQVTPGYAVETAYRPASEVGGDFFLVSPGSDGSLVAVVGDVSGKGLLAAMRVSLILGALNRETSRLPPEILQRLNNVLLGQGDMGFTTACCVRVEANGDFSFANAGHLNPYLDGAEVEAPGVLPLGLEPDQAYATITGHLHPGQRLVLLSDGVPEARAKRQLLGFDKLVELTRLGATEIADAAQNFGQEDDITVLALALA